MAEDLKIGQRKAVQLYEISFSVNVTVYEDGLDVDIQEQIEDIIKSNYLNDISKISSHGVKFDIMPCTGVTKTKKGEPYNG